jgi:fatty-acyl-CoA synthase
MAKEKIYSNTNLSESYWAADTSRTLLQSTIGEELRKAASEFPDRLAMVEGILDESKRRRWTYAELLADAERVASTLLTRFKPGQHIAVWGDNIPEWVLLEYGCALAGMVLVTVNPAYKARELEYVLKQSEAVAVFVIDEYRGFNTLEAAQNAWGRLSLLQEVFRFADFDAFMDSGDSSVTLPEVKPSDPFIIMYTSGTTGIQKGALLHHMGNLNANNFLSERAGLGEGGTWVNPMPMFHIGSCGLAVFGVLMRRGTHILVPEFNPELILSLFEKEKATFALLVPTMLEMILAFPSREKYDLSSWKNVMSGSSLVEEQLCKRIHKELGCGVSIVFGQTEMHGVVSATHREDSVEDQSSTLGQPMPHCEIKVVDPETGEVLPLGEKGEFCYRGYQTMLEYFNMPQDTEKTIDPDGWFHSGDLGTMDNRGFLKLTGRLKEMIIRGGENIYPREVEQLLLEHPKVKDVAVVGVPSQKWGEEVGAFIIPIDKDDPPTAKELHEFCRANLTHFKTPRLWYFVPEFKYYTPTMKLQKFKLRDLAATEELESERT